MFTELVFLLPAKDQLLSEAPPPPNTEGTPGILHCYLLSVAGKVHSVPQGTLIFKLILKWVRAGDLVSPVSCGQRQGDLGTAGPQCLPCIPVGKCRRRKLGSNNLLEIHYFQTAHQA